MTLPSKEAVRAYIRQAARARGIDPGTAVKVANSEGVNNTGMSSSNPRWQSAVRKGGRRETSYGPFQLLVGGGLGDKFKRSTGLNPADPSTWKQQVDFALNSASSTGWSPWYGAAKVGVSKWTGLKGANPVKVGAYTGKPARHSPQTEALQTKLAQLGFDPGPIDGVSGKRTTEALKAFQRVSGIDVDGKVGPQTVAAFENPRFAPGAQYAEARPLELPSPPVQTAQAIPQTRPPMPPPAAMAQTAAPQAQPPAVQAPKVVDQIDPRIAEAKGIQNWEPGASLALGEMLGVGPGEAAERANAVITQLNTDTAGIRGFLGRPDITPRSMVAQLSDVAPDLKRVALSDALGSLSSTVSPALRSMGLDPDKITPQQISDRIARAREQIANPTPTGGRLTLPFTPRARARPDMPLAQTVDRTQFGQQPNQQSPADRAAAQAIKLGAYAPQRSPLAQKVSRPPLPGRAPPLAKSNPPADFMQRQAQSAPQPDPRARAYQDMQNRTRMRGLAARSPAVDYSQVPSPAFSDDQPIPVPRARPVAPPQPIAPPRAKPAPVNNPAYRMGVAPSVTPGVRQPGMPPMPGLMRRPTQISAPPNIAALRAQIQAPRPVAAPPRTPAPTRTARDNYTDDRSNNFGVSAGARSRAGGNKYSRSSGSYSGKSTPRSSGGSRTATSRSGSTVKSRSGRSIGRREY